MKIQSDSPVSMNINSPVQYDVHGESADIEYIGIGGSSKDCQDAVLRFIQYGDRITQARILSSSRHHCLLLTVNVGELVAVKSGFTSGYCGEGPRTSSYVPHVLESHGAEIDELDVAPDFLKRLDNSAPTSVDLEALRKSRPLRPSRWRDYVYESDLALSFWDGPDYKLLIGYRRLEDIIRERTGINRHGTKLFSQAFNPTGGQLTWNDGDEGERAGKMNSFVRLIGIVVRKESSKKAGEIYWPSFCC